jgi:hypothetical protein
LGADTREAMTIFWSMAGQDEPKNIHSFGESSHVLGKSNHFWKSKVDRTILAQMFFSN